MDSQRTKPLRVRAGTEGGAKLSSVGSRECWHPVTCQIYEMDWWGTSTKRAAGLGKSLLEEAVASLREFIWSHRHSYPRPSCKRPQASLG